MTLKSPKDVFICLLSDVRDGTERTGKVWQEMAANVQDPDIKEALDARSFVSARTVEKIDKCFTLINAEPVKLGSKLQDVILDEFRKELGEIQSVPAKHLYILSRLHHLTHHRIGEYMALIAAADLTGHYAVGVLLESCLADNLSFVDRNRRLIRQIIENKIAARTAA